MNAYYMVVFPDGTEHLVAISAMFKQDRDHRLFKEIGEQAIKERKLTTSRRNPELIPLQIFDTKLENGKLVAGRRIAVLEIMPPLAPLTADEYGQELDDCLRTLPPEFASFVSKQAWDRGHASGREEVLQIAKEVAHDIGQAVTAFLKRIKEEL